MNEKNEPEAENKVSVLFRFYTRKVFSRIKPPEKTKQKSPQPRKNRDGEGEDHQQDRRVS
jgi:hypothetical protein